MFDQLVRSIGPAAVDERRHLAHLLRRPHEASVVEGHGLDQSRQRPRGRRHVHQTGALERQRAVVLGESLGQPQLARQVRAIEIERLEPSRPDALDVPAVEELVRERAEQPAALAPERRALADDRAVAMLHAVAVRPRQVVGEERVVPGLVLRELAVDGAFFADDLLDVLRERVEFGVGAEVVERDAEASACNGELPHRDRAEFDGAVHEVLKVRRGELER